VAQPNFQVDGLQIEPGSGQTLTITRQSSNGALLFKDAVVTGGLTLSDLANLSQVTGVLVVGRAGTGAKYTTITSALAAVPANASLTNPYVILVLPGVYAEAITIEKAGVTIQGIGRVVIQPATVAAAVTVQAAVTTTPTSLTLRGLTLNQTNDGLACVNLVGGAGSTVGSDGINIEDCNLVPSGVGCYTVYADTIDHVVLRNCWSADVPSTTSLRVAQCAGVMATGCVLPAVQMDYSTAGSRPSDTTSTYVLSGCPSVGNVQSTLSGAGSLTIGGCPSVGNITMNGNRTLMVLNSSISDLALNGTTAATVWSSGRGDATGTGTLEEERVSGVASLSSESTKAVTFDVDRPSDTYTVVLDVGVATAHYAASKTTSGFTITFSAPVIATVNWTVLA
jgi:hypothetical protein